MDYELVLRALREHVDTLQRTVDWCRENRKGVQFSQAFTALQQAIRAQQEVERAYKKSRVH